MKKIFVLSTVMFSVASLLLYLVFLKYSYDPKLVKDCNVVVAKVESFRKDNGRLPISLNEIGTSFPEDEPIFYEMVDDTSYIVYYNSGFDEGAIFSSKTHSWKHKP